MALIDWIIVILFLLVLISMGFRFSSKNTNLEDYFRGGRSMPTWVVALAATGATISAGTVIGSPEMGFNSNLTYLMLTVSGCIAGPLVAWLVIPKLYKSKAITIYGYLEEMLGTTTRRAGSVVFLLGQLFSSGARLFIAAIAVYAMLFGVSGGAINFQFLVYSILLLGIIATIYTMAGGKKGLVYIDALQLLLIVGTALVAFVIIWASLGGMSVGDVVSSLIHGQIKQGGAWVEGNKLQLIDSSFRFDVPYNLIGALVGCTLFKFAQNTTDHFCIQSMLTCKSVGKAAKSMIWSQVLSIPITLVFLLMGSLLFVKYSATDPAAFARYQADARDIYPQFICTALPMGLRGLMLVGLLAAALSSFNSAINAMASSFVTDLYLPIRQSRGKDVGDEHAQVSSSRYMVVLIGLILTAFGVLTAFMQEKSGMNLIDFATGIMSFAYAGMIGVFMCALFTKRGNAVSAIAALITGIAVVLVLQPYVCGPLTEALFGERMVLAWPWWCPLGGLLSFGVCCLGKRK